MTIPKYGLFILGAVALTILTMSNSAFADAITDTNVQFTANVTNTTVTLDIQCLNTAICGNWYLGDVTLKGFTFSSKPTIGLTAPSGYSLLNGGQDNNAVGTGGGCNGTQPGNAVCWEAPTILTTQLGGNVIEFTANITNGVPGTLHVQATGYTNSGGYQIGGGKVLAVSDDLSAAVPEPSTLTLLIAGLMGLALLGRKTLLP